MEDRKWSIYSVVLMVFCVLWVLFPPVARSAENASDAITGAKTAIEQARQTGAEKKAPTELSQAKAWLAQAEKAYTESQSILSRTIKLVVSNEERTREIVYLAVMAKAKALTAEAKTKKITVMDELKEAKKDLADYQTSIEVLNKKLAEAEKAKGVQAKAEAELKILEEAKRKTAELEALKQKELQQSRLLEAQRTAEREKEQGEAKLQMERLALKKKQDEEQMKTSEAKAAAEREKMVVMQQKMAAMEKEKAMVADAAKIPQSTVLLADGKLMITLLTVNLFSNKNELHNQGKALLDKVGEYLKKYPAGRISIRGYTDSSGKAAANRLISERRAQKVKEYLAAYQNIPAAEITAEGLGPAEPAASNATEAGRALNRRVKVAIPVGP